MKISERIPPLPRGGKGGSNVRRVNVAISVLKNGGVVVFPTETAYGIGCDARDSHAIEKLMQIKGREKGKTPPLIASDVAMAEEVVELSEKLRTLVRSWWPGALTVVAPVREAAHLSPFVVRGGTVAIRVSSHPTVRKLARALGAPIVATSANITGQPNCYRIEDVRAQLGTQLPQPDFFLDEGPLQVRAPSTIVQEQDGVLIVLRKGEIDVCNEQKNPTGKIG